jgi:PAS domain S-box-containing protein
LSVDTDRRSPITALPFPTDDLVFAQHVKEALRESTDATVEEAIERLRDRLRHVFPQVDARLRAEVAGFGKNPVVYVFRDGTARQTFTDSWVDDRATARLVTDQSGVYVDANDEAAAVFGVAREAIIGRKAGSFTRPDTRIEDSDALWRALAAKGRLHSLALVLRPDGTEIAIEFVTIRDGDGPNRNVTLLREVAAPRATAPAAHT